MATLFSSSSSRESKSWGPWLWRRKELKRGKGLWRNMHFFWVSNASSLPSLHQGRLPEDGGVEGGSASQGIWLELSRQFGGEEGLCNGCISMAWSVLILGTNERTYDVGICLKHNLYLFNRIWSPYVFCIIKRENKDINVLWVLNR